MLIDTQTFHRQTHSMTYHPVVSVQADVARIACDACRNKKGNYPLRDSIERQFPLADIITPTVRAMIRQVKEAVK